MHDDSRDRLIALEVKVQHLSNQVEDMGEKVDELVALLQQMRGARWLFGILWLGAGSGIGLGFYKLLSIVGFKVGS